MVPLLDALGDEDWFVRQGAHVALMNLTGMELAFDALVSESERLASTQSTAHRACSAISGSGSVVARLNAGSNIETARVAAERIAPSYMKDRDSESSDRRLRVLSGPFPPVLGWAPTPDEAPATRLRARGSRPGHPQPVPTRDDPESRSPT